MKVTAPDISPNLDTGHPAQLQDEASIEQCSFEDADWTGAVARSASIDEVVVEKSLFIDTSLEKLNVRDAIFKNCDFSTAHCSTSSYQRVFFGGGRMTGWDCSQAMFKDVTFENCKLDMANFRFAKLTNVEFKNCVLADTDFMGAELNNVAFESSTLERTILDQCKLKSVDLRSSQLIELKGWPSLKGATIDTEQLMTAAPYLANELGIKVLD